MYSLSLVDCKHGPEMPPAHIHDVPTPAWKDEVPFVDSGRCTGEKYDAVLIAKHDIFGVLKERCHIDGGVSRGHLCQHRWIVQQGVKQHDPVSDRGCQRGLRS